MEYILLYNENHNLININAHSIIKYFYKKEKLKILDFKNIKLFLENNKNSKLFIFFYIYINWNFGYDLINFIKNEMINKNNKIFIFTDDYWNTGSNIKYLNIIFDTQNKYKVFTSSHSIDNLLIYCTRSSSYKNSIIKYRNDIIYFNFWCCYNDLNIKENHKPINKLLISGRTWNKVYTPRYLLSKLKNCVTLNYSQNKSIVINKKNLDYYYKNVNINPYSLELNKYIACFSSSVYNTNVILLKTFEILESGSLLVLPLSEKKYIKEIGLIDRHNCWLIDFNKDLQIQVDEILVPSNRYLVDVIRRNGHSHSNNLKESYLIEKLFNKIKLL